MPTSSPRPSGLEIEYQLLVTLRRVRWTCFLAGPLFFAVIFAVLKCRHSVEELEVFLLCGAALGFLFGLACERFAAAMIGTLIQVVRFQADSLLTQPVRASTRHDGIEASKQLS